MQTAERALAWNFGRFVWHDIVTRDVKRSKRFYAGLFGWRYQDLRMGSGSYAMILGPGGPQGGLALGSEPGAAGGHIMPFLSVADVDAAARTAVDLGGQVLSAPLEIAGAGRLAVLADGGGARFSIIHSSVGDSPSTAVRPGMFRWEELHSRTPTLARRFYQKVAGWRCGPAPDGAQERQLFFPGAGDTTDAAAGLTPIPSPTDESDGDSGNDHWLSYVQVADLAAAQMRVRRLGGRVLATAVTAGRSGRLAIIEDELGIRLGLLQAMAG